MNCYIWCIIEREVNPSTDYTSLFFRLNPSGAQYLTPGMRKYWCKLSLDVNTAHRALQVSEDQRTVTHVDEEQPYPDHPDRFDFRPQVLSTALIWRCYWEVKWEGCGPDQPGWVDITVCYKSLKRKGGGKECLFGLNDESWTLTVFKGQYSFRHRGREFRIPCVSSHVAVYLDPRAGFLAFYEVYPDGSQGILHSVNTSFTETLVAGFGSYRSSISLM
ncbi:stonustoxin subunit alpha-like [Eucyclogobius newberryi]|uniref:stonustoxin subunit alpha-like n=1 Tax=Eucyclogobius newberryi TaxID=166745 RepID=UPI003B59ED06